MTADTSTPLGLLQAARALLTDPDHWTKAAWGRLPQAPGGGPGDNVEADDPRACRWCAIGALHKVAPSSSPDGEFEYTTYDWAGCDPVGVKAIEFLSEAIGGGYFAEVTEWNDDGERTHEDLLAAFDSAIRLASEGAS